MNPTQKHPAVACTRANPPATRLATPLGSALAAALLSACTFIPHDPPNAEAAPTTGAAVKAEKTTTVGSRLPNSAGDRLVRRTDAAGAKEMNRERPPEAGPRVN